RTKLSPTATPIQFPTAAAAQRPPPSTSRSPISAAADNLAHDHSNNDALKRTGSAPAVLAAHEARGVGRDCNRRRGRRLLRVCLWPRLLDARQRHSAGCASIIAAAGSRGAGQDQD